MLLIQESHIRDAVIQSSNSKNYVHLYEDIDYNRPQEGIFVAFRFLSAAENKKSIDYLRFMTPHDFKSFVTHLKCMRGALNEGKTELQLLTPLEDSNRWMQYCCISSVSTESRSYEFEFFKLNRRGYPKKSIFKLTLNRLTLEDFEEELREWAEYID